MAESKWLSEVSARELDNRSWLPIVAVVLCLTVATAMVGLRIWTRASITKRIGVDDWAAVFTLIPTYACGITIALSTESGLGRHYLILPVDEIIGYLKYYWFSLLFYRIGLLAVKVTFLLQYYRLLTSRRLHLVYTAAIFIVGGWCLAQVLITVFICQPLRKFWDPRVEGTCIAPRNQDYISVGGNTVTDVAVLVLAIPVVRHLSLTRAQKLPMFAVFALGLFTIAISLISIKFIELYGDPTWDDVEVWGWSIGQLTSALTCACLPTLRPFLAKFFPSLAHDSTPNTTIDRAEMSGDSGEHHEYKGWFRPRDAQGGYLPEADGGVGTMVYEKGDSDEARQSPSHDEPVLDRGTRTRTRTSVGRHELGTGWESHEMPA